jgi:hypothetical protein
MTKNGPVQFLTALYNSIDIERELGYGAIHSTDYPRTIDRFFFIKV